jgi:uncharacterized iron-regulated membrane protein
MTPLALRNLAALCYTAGVFSALFGAAPGITYLILVLALAFTGLASYVNGVYQRRIAALTASLMQTQAEMNAEALMRAARRERDNEAEITAKLDEIRAKLEMWAREDAAAKAAASTDKKTGPRDEGDRARSGPL